MAALAERLHDILWEGLLPLWAERGYDGLHGGFHNRLDADLEPAPDGYKRLVVQTRQLYSFAWAARETGHPMFRERAEQGYAFLCAHYRDPVHGGWFYTTAVDGEPLDRSKDTYAHAFVLLALAEWARTCGGSEPLDRARETLELIDARLRDPDHGGYRERAREDWSAWPEPLPRRQNPHMHLFEAFAALHRASGEKRYLERAAELSDLLCEHWIDAQGRLGEYFTQDWQPAPRVESDPPRFEPGHHFEWVWLLHQSPELRARPALARAAEQLFASAAGSGLDPSDGGAFDGLDASGRAVRDTKRLWPQTEYLKALACRAERSGCSDASRRLPLATQAVLERYHDARTGGFFEHARRDGQIFSTLMNATSVYHVITALLEVARVLSGPPGATAPGAREVRPAPRARRDPSTEN